MTHAKDSQWIDWSGVSLLAVAIFCTVAALLGGCSPNYRQLRNEGQLAMLNGEYGRVCDTFGGVASLPFRGAAAICPNPERKRRA